jgi:nucleotide-binding universal stress UspA family protein
MRLDRIVVGVDFSPPCVRAVDWVARVLAPGATIALAHVRESEPPPEASDGARTLDSSIEERERRRASDRLGDLARNAGIPLARTEVLTGNPATGLSAVADEHRADLIVLGAHRSRAGLRTWLGGTAEQLLGLTRVPVLVVAQVADGPPRRVLAAAADPLLSSCVRDWADALAARFAASEVVMRLTPDTDPDVRGAPRMPAPDCDPDERVLDEAEHCRDGIIVLGIGGAGQARGTLRDGATTTVLRRATCPVIAVSESGPR